MDHYSLKAVRMFLLLPFLLCFHHSLRNKKLVIVTRLFKKLIHETQNNLHQLTTHMSMSIMWHNTFSENKAVEVYIPRHWDSKTKKTRHRHSRTKKLRHLDSGMKTPWHRETETPKPRHRDSKALFHRTKRHDIEIPRLKNHDVEILRTTSNDIKFLLNSDPYAP